MTQGPDSQSIR